MSNDCFLSLASGERTYSFPLFSQSDPYSLLPSTDREPNLAQRFLYSLASGLGLDSDDDESERSNMISPENVFYYVYSILHSPIYRSRYAEFLRIEFPRLPLPSCLDLLSALIALGGELVRLHLMESPKTDDYITAVVGSGDCRVEKVSYSDETVWINKARRHGFQGVPKEVWDFHIGGYQVCEKWLKDRGPKKGNPGRVLTDEDIDHYQKIVVALSETIRITAEIDEVIEAHGGWPGAFQTVGASMVPEGESTRKGS